MKKEFHEIVDSASSTDVGTLLHFAAEKGDADGVRALLSSGANPCVQNENGRTALQCTVKEDVRSAFTQELLQAVAQSKYALINRITVNRGDSRLRIRGDCKPLAFEN